MSASTPPAPSGRSDWRKALDVYVAARSRVLDAEEKRQLAERTLPASADGARPPGSRPTAKPARVTVPRNLEFFRNAGTWRDRLPGGESVGDSASHG